MHCKKDSFQQLLFWDRETSRWEKALKEGRQTLLQELYEKHLPSQDFLRQERKLCTVHLLLQEGIRFASELAPRLFEEDGGRAKYDRYLSAINYLLPRLRGGILLKGMLHMLKLNGASERIESYSVHLGKAVQTFYSMFKPAGLYVRHWQEAETMMRSFSHEPQENLVALYTSYQAFPDNARFESFHEVLSNTCNNAVTVIIEDLVTLYLMIAQDFVEIIVRLPLLERIEEFDRDLPDRKLVENDLREFVLEWLVKYPRDSEHRLLFNKLVRKMAEKAIDSWYKEEQELRRQYPQELWPRFVEQFKNGLLFN